MLLWFTLSKMAKAKQKSKLSLAKIVGFIANLIIPGLGTIILERYDLGVIQISLTIACLLMIFTNSLLKTIAIIALAAVWLWALAAGISTIKKGKKQGL